MVNVSFVNKRLSGSCGSSKQLLMLMTWMVLISRREVEMGQQGNRRATGYG